jgi:hypothetical protein
MEARQMVKHHYIPQDTDPTEFLAQLRADIERELGVSHITYSAFALKVTSGYVEEWQLVGERRCHIQFFEAGRKWEMLVYFPEDLEEAISTAIASVRKKTLRSKPKEHYIEIPD